MLVIVAHRASARHLEYVLYILGAKEKTLQSETLEQVADNENAQPKATEKVAKGRQRLPKPLHFPRPPKFKCSPDQFFKYWRTLPQECLNRSMVYVYSAWPILNPMQAVTQEEAEEIAKHKRRAPPSNIDKPDQPFESDDWEAEVLHRWGSGSLHFKLNDSGVSGNSLFPAKPIATCDIKDLNHPDYPPVRDWRLLDMAHPGNQSLIVNLRAKGIKLPGDDDLKTFIQEEDDMANVAAVEKLADTVVQMARDNTRNNQQQPAPAAPDVQGLAGAKAVESVAEGAKQGFAIMSEAIKKANEVQAQSKDPKAYINDLREVAQLMQPPATNSGNADLLAIMKMNHESHMAEMRAMNERLAAAELRNQALLDKLISKPESTERPRSFIQELKTLSEGRDVIKDLFGMGGEEESLPWYGSALMKALEIIPGAVTNFMHNVAVARAGQGVPQAPDAEVEEDEPAKIEAPKPSGQDAIIINTLGQLKDAIIQALATGAPGYDFAAALIHETKSEQLYGFLSSQGKAGLFTILQKHQELWSATRPYAQQLEKFADQFLDKARVQEALSVANAKPNGAPTPGRPIIGADGLPIQHQGPKINKPS
jgi:hypothetical protein